MLKNTFKTIYVWMNSILFEWIKWPIMELIWGGFFLHWEVKSHWEEFSSDMVKERHAVVARKKLSNKHFSFKCKKNDKLSLSKLQLYVIAWKKNYVVTNYESVFKGVGHHYFLNLHTILRMPTVILTAYVVRACLFILLRLTVVVCLHYLSCVKRK